MDESPESRFVERRSAYLEGEETEPRRAETEVPEEPRRTEIEAPAEARPSEPSEPEKPAALDLEEIAQAEVPEPSFYEIVQPLEIQALQFLGELPLTAQGERGVLPGWAKHVIDLLGILEERTRGNLSPEEAQYLEQVLADLRTRYIRVAT